MASDETGDLRAVKPDIGKRVVVEGHQFGIGLLPAPPLRNASPGRHDQVDCGHG